MQCPKCKNLIPKNALRCPNCNLKVKIVCPNCKTVSAMGKKFCAECGFAFFKKCEICGTVNLSTSKVCRKCKSDLQNKKAEEPQIIVQPEIIEPETVIQQVAETAPIIQEVIEPQQDIIQPSETQNFEPVVETQTPESFLQDFEHADIIEPEPQEEMYDEQMGDVILPEETIEQANSLSEEETSQEEEFFEHEGPEFEQISENEEPEIKVTPDGFMISNDEVELSEEQFQNIIEKVDEIDKHLDRKSEADTLIQQKFERQEEIESEKEEIIPPEYIQLNQKDAQTTIVDAIQNPIKRIISLNGKEGLGKSLILKYVREALRGENYVWAWGECNALTQITPFGYLQDVLLNLFNLSNFSANINDFIKSNTKALEAQFFNLTPSEINDLFNFLYPIKTSEFNGILKRKEYTINIIKKVFENFTIKSLVIFVADDFENIDGASFDFLKNILSDPKFEEKIKIIITNKHNKIAQGYFFDKELKHNNYSNIFLSPAQKDECKLLVDALYGSSVDLPDSIENQIYENSKGTSVYVEQACLLMNEIGAIIRDENGEIMFNQEFTDYVLPVNSYRILEERLNAIEKDYPIVVKILYIASILGNKFSIHQLENVVGFLRMPKDDFVTICNFLIEKNYLTQFGENYFAFNNTVIWHYVYERAKTDENFVEFNKNIYACVEPLYLSNNSLKPLLLQSFDNKREACEYWKKNADLASYLGDTNLYVISLKQQLKISNDITDIITAQEKIRIYEKMGKILYKLSSKESVNYLSASIAYYKEKMNYNPVKVIELSAFLVQACNNLGNYLGVIEACDVALSALPFEEYQIEKAIISSKKLGALLYLGNCEEIVNTVKTGLLDVMENALANANASNIISDTQIFDAWVETSLNLACAYALQGSKKSFDILSKVDDAILANKSANEQACLRKILITKALAYTMRGEIKLSSETLTEITSKYSTDDMEESFILRWNLINIINKIITKDYQNLVDEMFQVTTFADNINDTFTKNILKLLLGYIIQTKSKNLNKAVEIYDEEVVFFSKEKIATGALLCWYLISDASMTTQGVDFALDIAQKALEVAKGPKVNNYLFIVALKLLIADIYLIKHDFDAVIMYLEKASAIIKAQDLRFMQIVLSQKFAKYYEEMISVNPDNAQDYAQQVIEMYLSALKLAQTMSLSSYESSIGKDFVAFKAFCKLKNLMIAVDE